MFYYELHSAELVMEKNDLFARQRSSNVAKATSLMRTHQRARHNYSKICAHTHVRSDVVPYGGRPGKQRQTSVHNLALTARRAAFTASSIANEYG